MSAQLASFPHRSADPGPGIGALFTKGNVTTLLALVTAVDVGWARRMRLRLHSSLGHLAVEGNLDQLPEDVQAGDWVRVRAMRRHGEGETPLKLMRLMKCEPSCKAAWLPNALCHRLAHAERLRVLLSALEPSLQMVVMLALADPQVQRRFFWRVGAADHHSYPGGLFDQSVEAAELASLGGDEEPHVHSLAAVAALLFDLGKVGDDALADDWPRSVGPHISLAPHRLTLRRLQRAIERTRQLDEVRMDELQAVLFAAPTELAPSPPLQRAAHIARKAVWQTWQARQTSIDISMEGPAL